jgi:hypothetical protein
VSYEVGSGEIEFLKTSDENAITNQRHVCSITYYHTLFQGNLTIIEIFRRVFNFYFTRIKLFPYPIKSARLNI